MRFSYGDMSPFNRFFFLWFFPEETILFHPFSLTFKDQGINIDYQGLSLKNDSMQIVRSANKIILEGLPIADANHQKLPYEYFNEINKRIGHKPY